MWNFLKIDRLLTKRFTQKFKQRYNHKRKESQGPNPKNYLPEKAPKEKSPKSMSLYESFDISEGVIGVAKIAIFPWKTMDRYFWLSLKEHFQASVFPSVFFLRPRRKYTKKKPRRNLVNENSSKIRRNTNLKNARKNYAKCR